MKIVSFIGIFLTYAALVAQSDVKTRIYEVWDDQPAPNIQGFSQGIIILPFEGRLKKAF